jgi:hypothetical protein
VLGIVFGIVLERAYDLVDIGDSVGDISLAVFHLSALGETLRLSSLCPVRLPIGSQ